MNFWTSIASTFTINLVILLFVFNYLIDKRRREWNALLFIFSKCLMAIAIGLILLRGIANVYGIHLSNILILLFIAITIEVFSLVSYNHIFNKKVLRFILLNFAVFAVLYLFSDHKDLEASVILAAFYLTILFGYGSFHFFTKLKSDWSKSVIGSLYLFLALIPIAWIISSSFLVGVNYFENKIIIEDLYLVMGQLAILISGLGFFVLSKDEDEKVIKDQKRKLLVLNKELDRFVYSVSHDIRAPIASILGLINIARTMEVLPEMKHVLDLQETSVERLNAFTTKIIDYSKNLRLEVKTEQVFIKDIIESSLKEFNIENKAHQIEVRENADFHNDALRIGIIINNILSNAVKFASYNVSVYAEVNDTETLIEIEDDGPGISREYHESVFKMFFRAHESKSGSGLGLYIAREAISNLNGHIELISEPGCGTKIVIRIPNLIPKSNYKSISRNPSLRLLKLKSASRTPNQIFKRMQMIE